MIRIASRKRGDTNRLQTTFILQFFKNRHWLKFSFSSAVGFFLSETPMLDDGEEGGVRLWHLVKASEDSELPKHRRGSMREKGGERAKAIPEIYLTRLLSMKVKRFF